MELVVTILKIQILMNRWAVIFCFHLLVILFSACDGPEKASRGDIKKNNDQTNAYIGDQQCLSCHAEQTQSWASSHHAKAMMHASDSTVLGDFGDITFTGSGVSSFFFKRDGLYYVETEGPTGKNETYQIKYTFGLTPLQQYLVEFPGGRMQALRTAWDTQEKQWYDLYPNQEIITADWLHWTRGGLNWNTMCAECHSTDLKKGYDLETDTYNTTFSQINVSCESCHGPGEKHLSWASTEPRDSNAYMLLTSDIKSVEQVRACAPCHSRKGNLSSAFTFNGEFLQDFVPEILSDGLYHADGQIQDEVYVYGSFLQSKMYHNNVRCTDCHDPHTLQLKKDGNELCMQCHEPRYDTRQHTFHEAGTEAGSCISCHMPGKIYMGVDFRRDHSFRVPRPDLSVEYGVPNACNGCHNDKNASWAAENIIAWYGKERAYHFSEALVMGRQRIAGAVPGLDRLLADTSQPDIARATAAYYLADIPTRESFTALARGIVDSSAMVRYYTASGLMNIPIQDRVNWVGHLLRDSVRGVRIAAAEALADFPKEQLPLELQTAFNSALYEYETSLKSRADFPMGRFMLGQYYYRTGQVEKAKQEYANALNMDTLLHIARENLARIYNQQQNNKKAIELLQTTLSFEKNNGQALYSLGLIYAEESKLEEATIYLSQAVQAMPENERTHYNLGLAYQHLDKLAEAEKAYLEGLKILPESAAIRQALAILYLQQNEKEKARPHVEELEKRFPGSGLVEQLK